MEEIGRPVSAESGDQGDGGVCCLSALRWFANVVQSAACPSPRAVLRGDLREGATKRLQLRPFQGPAGLTHRRANQSDPSQLLRLINTEPELIRPSEPATARRTRPTQQRNQDSNKTLMTRITRKRRHPPSQHNDTPVPASAQPNTGENL